MTDKARKRLKEGIKKVGILGPIVWNETTGNIVGGHQRLSALDSINGGKDYTITVSAVQLTEAREREANILLNNPEAQGEWDMEKLGVMLKDPVLDLVAAGMGSADVYNIVGDDSPDHVLIDCAERINAARDIATDTKKASDKHSTDYYLVVVFRDHDHRREFTEAMALDDNRYVSGEDLLAALTDPEETETESEQTPRGYAGGQSEQ